jgi:DNA polymerase-1
MGRIKLPEVIVIDFETDEIKQRPDYPPRPVGYSVLFSNEPSKTVYHAWGHPTTNNTTLSVARKTLMKLWKDPRPKLFHNSKFDYAVALEELDMPELPWQQIHDTLFLLFLDDPHARTLSLKPAAQRILGMSPKEQEAVRQWLVDHKVCRKNDARWGRFISKAPGHLVGEYAKGDVIRTWRLFKKLWPDIVKREMLGAYDRERELMPALLENEQQGIEVNSRLLRNDMKMYEAAKETADRWLRKRLKVKELNVDSDKEVGDALEAAGVVREWVYTETGQRSVAKKNLTPGQFSDKKVASVLGYRNRLGTCISMFMKTWVDMSESSGVIHTDWSQVRQSGEREGGLKGARTGRLASSPNFMNIPTSFDAKNDGYEHPKFIVELPPLPMMRRYLIPGKGYVWGNRDYNQQELRILAHYEGGVLMEAYINTPRLDVHEFVRQLIYQQFGVLFERRAVKIINFGMIYGMGKGKLAIDLNTTVEEAAKLQKAHRSALPGVRDLEREIKRIGREGDFIRTWGGRQYYVEPPKVIKGKERTFEYKLLNYLIQGSGADATKQSIVNYHRIPRSKRLGRFLVTVHDENNAKLPKEQRKEAMAQLKESMECLEFDVKLLSDEGYGRNWYEAKK